MNLESNLFFRLFNLFFTCIYPCSATFLHVTLHIVFFWKHAAALSALVTLDRVVHMLLMLFQICLLSESNSAMADEGSLTCMWPQMIIEFIWTGKQAMAAIIELTLKHSEMFSTVLFLVLLEPVYNILLIWWNRFRIFCFFCIKNISRYNL